MTSYLTATTTYLYDGEGRRVRKSQAAARATEYVYDASGQVAAEYTISGNAAASPCATCYLMTDHPGSTRMMTDAQLAGGAVQVRALHDYLPFGEELPIGADGRDTRWSSAAPTLKFTGKERDESWESGLDYFGARCFSGAQGRFTSADPFLGSGRAEEPQSWNRYGYAGNNPLRFVDPTGLDYYDQNGNRIGTDGNTDGNDYVVTDADQIDIIRRNSRARGGTTALDQVDSAILLPGATVRAGIGDAVSRSNAPSDAAGDQQGGSHEEGGAWGLNAAGNQIATPGAPGAFADLRQPGAVVAQIDPALAANPARQNDIQTPQGVFHVHPRAQVTMPDGTLRVFNQFPSAADIGAAASMNIVVGARDRTVYFYNGGGQRATMPLNRFLRLPR